MPTQQMSAMAMGLQKSCDMADIAYRATLQVFAELMRPVQVTWSIIRSIWQMNVFALSTYFCDSNVLSSMVVSMFYLCPEVQQ